MSTNDPHADLRDRVREQIRSGRVTVLPRPADESLPPGSGVTLHGRPSRLRRVLRWLGLAS